MEIYNTGYKKLLLRHSKNDSKTFFFLTIRYFARKDKLKQ